MITQTAEECLKISFLKYLTMISWLPTRQRSVNHNINWIQIISYILIFIMKKFRTHKLNLKNRRRKRCYITIYVRNSNKHTDRRNEDNKKNQSITESLLNPYLCDDLTSFVNHCDCNQKFLYYNTRHRPTFVCVYFEAQTLTWTPNTIRTQTFWHD